MSQPIQKPQKRIKEKNNTKQTKKTNMKHKMVLI